MRVMRGGQFLRATVVVLLAGLAGCGKGSATLTVAVPTEKQTRYGEGGGMPTVRLPADAAFNHFASDRHSTGDARAESTAAPNGTGSAFVEVSTTGVANAAFQVGHVLYSGASAAVDAVVAFDCKFAYEVRGADLVKHAPDSIDLRIVVEDANQRRLNEIALVNQVDRFGPQRREGHESPSFSLRLEPGVAYVLRVTGRLSATAEADSPTVEARLELQSLAVEVRPASPTERGEKVSGLFSTPQEDVGLALQGR